MFPAGLLGMPPVLWRLLATVALAPAALLLRVNTAREVVAFGGKVKRTSEAAGATADVEFNANGEALV